MTSLEFGVELVDTDADDVHAARRAAHPERDADTAAAEHAANQTLGQLIAAQNARPRDKREKHRRRRDGQQGLEHHAVIDPPPRDA